MKRMFFYLIATGMSILCLYAQSTDYTAFLKKVDAQVTFADTDLSAEYTIEKKEPGGDTETTVAAMFRRDAKDQYLILILEPQIDKGKGYLKTGDTLWLYDPVDKSFTFTSAKDRFQNSSIRNSDFERSNYSINYKVSSAKAEMLGKFKCMVLDLQAINNKVSFPRVKLWVSEDYLIRKIEDYSLSGQLMRTTAMPTYQQIQGRWLPVQMVILDHLVSKKSGNKTEYERTTVTIRNPSVKKLPDSVYTKEYLERVSR